MGMNVSGLRSIRSERNEPRWMHLRHPVDNHELWHGPGADAEGRLVKGQLRDQSDPVRVLVLSNASDKYKVYLDRKLMDARKRKRKDPHWRDKLTIDDLAQEDVRDIAACIVDIQGMEKDDGTEYDASVPEDVADFCSIHEGFRRQIEDFSCEERNFFGHGSSATS